MAGGNDELVEKAARMCRDLGREVASIGEARELLGLPVQARTLSA